MHGNRLQPASPPQTADGAFATTQWTMIFEAARSGHEESSCALSKLCEVYWLPVYAFIRRYGHDAETAKDLTQGFFVRLLDKRPFATADKAKGKFRTYLLGSVKFFLSDEHEKAQAQKRGGGAVHLSLQVDGVEALLEPSLADAETPDVMFDRQWVRTIMNEAEIDLRDECVRKGKADTFEMLIPFVLEDRGEAGVSYQELATQQGVSDGALRMAANRLRKRYGQLLREKVVATVEDMGDVDGEVRYLLSVLSGR